MNELILWGIISGLIATFFMDLGAVLLMKAKLVSLKGLQIVPPLLGRWVRATLFKGQLFHQDIRTWPTQKKENLIGFVCHYLIGAGLGIVFAFIFHEQYILWGLVYGLLTNIFPWCVMYPSMGFGFFAKKLDQTKALLKFSLINHLIYGISLGLFINTFLA